MRRVGINIKIIEADKKSVEDSSSFRESHGTQIPLTGITNDGHMPVLILDVFIFIDVIPLLGRRRCREKGGKKERGFSCGFAGEFFCAKGSSCQQKELQLKSWLCSFGPDEVYGPQERTKGKGETATFRRREKWEEAPGKEGPKSDVGTDDPVDTSLSSGTTTFWTLFQSRGW